MSNNDFSLLSPSLPSHFPVNSGSTGSHSSSSTGEANEINLVQVATGSQTTQVTHSVPKPNPNSASEILANNQAGFFATISRIVGNVKQSITEKFTSIPLAEAETMQKIRASGGTLVEHPVIQAFLEDSGPKMLLISEQHGSEATTEARRYVASRQDTIKGFSEGTTGHPLLAGLSGLEGKGEANVGSILRDYLRTEGSDIVGADTNPQELIDHLEEFGVPQQDIDNIKRYFIPEKNPKKRLEQVTIFQNHQRDVRLAKKIRQQCQELARDPQKSIAVGFFGATHMMPGFDKAGDDVRTTDQRIPHFLGSMGKPGENCIRVEGVNIYYFPEVLKGNASHLDSNFKELF